MRRRISILALVLGALLAAIALAAGTANASTYFDRPSHASTYFNKVHHTGTYFD